MQNSNLIDSCASVPFGPAVQAAMQKKGKADAALAFILSGSASPNTAINRTRTTAEKVRRCLGSSPASRAPVISALCFNYKQMKTINKLVSDLLLVGIAAFAGILSILMPYIVTNGYKSSYSDSISLFPLLSAAWEGLNPIPTSLIMVAVGACLGLIKPRYWFILGISSILLLIAVAIIEMYKNPTFHNLWPFEFALYFVFIALPTLLGAYIGFKIKKKSNPT